MDCKNFNCRECKNPKCNRMAIGGDYCTACQHIYDELEAENEMLKDLAIDAANELEFHHPNSDIPDRLEKIL